MAVDQETPQPAPAVPDYLASPNAVFDDEGVQWRYGQPPDYSKTRKVWEESKSMNHAAGSLPQLVENLVKNWEVEASFKPRLQDWRTIDHDNYSFAINGGPPQSAEHMLKVGTYNAIIAPNQYYDPANSDFASSHKTFKRMMPTFAWEVLEVYSGPPRVAFKWRHWGTMKNDYVGFNDKGEKVTAKAHGGSIDIQGVTVAQVDDKVRLQSVETWFDPLEMFRQISPQGIVNLEAVSKKLAPEEALDTVPDHDGVKIAEEHKHDSAHASEPAPQEVIPPHISNSTGLPADAHVPHQGADPTQTDDSRSHTQGDDAGAAQIVDTARTMGVDMPIDHPTANAGGACPFLVANGGLSTESEQTRASNDTVPAPAAAPQDQAQLQPQHDPADSTVDSTALVTDKSNPSSIPDNGTATHQPAPAAGSSSNPNETTNNNEDGADESVATGTRDAVDAHLEAPADQVHPHAKAMERAVQPQPGEAVIAPAASAETQRTLEEMSRVSPDECVGVLNRE